MTNVLGLPGTSQTNIGSLTYTSTEIRPSQIFISNPVTGVTEVFHNGLSGLIPTYSPPTDGIIYNDSRYGFYPATDISTLNNTNIFDYCIGSKIKGDKIIVKNANMYGM